jgi:hypothetical protein
MVKFSQRELLSEGFLDKIRTAGRVAKAIGRGAKAVASGITALDPEGFRKLGAPIKTLTSPAVGVAKGIAAITPSLPKQRKNINTSRQTANQPIQKPNFDSVIAKYKSRLPQGITVQQLSNVLSRELNIQNKQASRIVQGATDIDTVILDVTGKMNLNDILDSEDIKRVKSILQHTLVIERKVTTQKSLLEQLKNIM